MVYPKPLVMKAILLFLSAPSLVTAHTWVEQLMAIAPNGTMVGKPGFPRNNIQRTTPGFNDAAMVYLIPPNGGPPNKIDTNQLMCRPGQTSQTQTPNNPRLKVAPGQAVALRYQENGHVTLPQNTPGKPQNGGANFVYYTADPKSDDKFLQIHRQWTPDGKGGDGRGRLISTQNFDDGQCYQVNGQAISKLRQTEFKHQVDSLQGSDLWCQQDIQIPADAKVGATITLYWVWDWPTLPGTSGFPEGKQEIYTTCMDIDIIAPAGQVKVANHGFVKQDFGSAAAASQFADIGNPTAIKAQLIPFSKLNVGTSSSTGSQPTTTTTLGRNPSSTSSRPTATTTPGRSSSRLLPSSTVDVPSQITVTVRETVTATAFPSRSRKASLPPITLTATETDFVTVTVTKTSQIKRESESSSVPSSTDLSSSPGVLTIVPVTASAPTKSGSCSTAQRAYRLRARNPFYILPSSDQPNPSAGAGC